MSTILVRHASAGDRESWRGDDQLRPLDERGRAQAAALVEQLGDRDLDRIVSSPYLRCTQTLAPLAAQRELGVEERDELAEGASRAKVEELLAELDGEDAVLCTHGDVVEELLGEGLKKGEFHVLAG